jgi:hypothetical protein
MMSVLRRHLQILPTFEHVEMANCFVTGNTVYPVFVSLRVMKMLRLLPPFTARDLCPCPEVSSTRRALTASPTPNLRVTLSPVVISTTPVPTHPYLLLWEHCSHREAEGGGRERDRERKRKREREREEQREREREREREKGEGERKLCDPSHNPVQHAWQTMAQSRVI